MIRQCKVCKKYFSVEDPRDSQMACSTACQNQWNVMDTIWGPDKVGVCQYCGKQFYKTTSSKIYCDSNCRRKASYDKKKESNGQKSAKDIRKCVICGKPLDTTGRNTHNRKYCSPECKQIGKKQRASSRKQYYTHVYENSTVESQTTFTKGKKASKNQTTDVPNNPGADSIKPTNSKPDSSKIRAVQEILSHRQRVMSAAEEMEAWYASKRERKKWKKVPLEEADAICKQYGLSYPQYQYMKYEGTLTQYLATHQPKDI